MIDTFVERLREIGVCADSRVVVYDESRLAFAARLWWLLRYLGHETVHVLNGGFAAWREAGFPVASEMPRAKRGNFAARLVPELLIDRPALLALVNEPDGNTVIVDARERKRYRGDEEPIDRVAGHIPGAVCYPWQDTTTADGRVISAAANRQRWSAVSPTTPIVVYCGSGVTACADILSLQRAGFSNVKLYAGSWSDWCSYLDSPIAIGD
jgi:thiosulfate/3-mercaptopyruvate sulfurtransferase